MISLIYISARMDHIIMCIMLAHLDHLCVSHPILIFLYLSPTGRTQYLHLVKLKQLKKEKEIYVLLIHIGVCMVILLLYH